MMPPRTAMTLAASLALVAGCVQVYPQPEQPTPTATAGQASDSQQAQNGQKDEKGPFKPYDEVLKDTRAIEGLLKMHLKRDQTLFLELRPDQLDRDFGLVMHYSRGLGDFNVHDGLYLSDAQLMRFERVGDRVLLVERNARFTADAGTPMERSMQDNVGHSVLAAFDIQSRHEETGNLIVDVTEFFLSDYPLISERLKFYYGNKPVIFEKDRSYVDQVMGFPGNMEIDALLTYRANDFPAFGGAGVSDFRSIPVGVRYSFFELPEHPMRPRLADDRVGHFLTAHMDFSRDQEETGYVRYVERWRLQKKEPAAAVSEPVEPIVFYIDHSVPHEYRRYVKEGIEGWNKAFEAAGFQNAIVAREAPDDSTWSAEDVRYSTVRWTAAYAMGYAIGPSQADPRTGELLNADILISHTFVRGWLYDWQELGNPTALIQRYMEAIEMQRQMPPHLSQRMCLAELGMAHQLGVQYAFLVGLGVLDPGEPMPEEYLGDAIRDLVLHEVGHTLGLRHNFKASSGIPHDRLNDTRFTTEHGVSLSVMDYAPVNVAVNPRDQGHYWNKEVGTYDVWAIRYAYTPISESTTNGVGTNGEPAASPEAELDGLRQIAEEVANPLHTYGTDEDNWLGPYAVDPLTNAWDLGSDPLQYAQNRASIIGRVQPQLEGRLIAEGEAWPRLRGAMSNMIFERFISLLPVTKTVGGLYFVRDHKNDPNARPPFTPVSAERQREAVRLIIENAFRSEPFQLDPDVLNKLAPSRWSHWGTGFFRAPVDFPIHDLAAQIQRVMLIELMSPPRLTRIVDNGVRMPAGQAAYTLADLFGQLTAGIWTELGADGSSARNIDSFRRNLQRMYTDQLIAYVVSPPPDTPEDARSLARYHLASVQARIDRAREAQGLDDLTRAHLDETAARIGRALDAKVTIEGSRPIRSF